MSALDELFDLIDEDICLHYTTRDARAELAALRARVEQAERERDEARKQLETIKEIADEELRRGNAGMWYQVEAEARHGLTESGGSATLTPRRCVTCCTEAAKAMREAAADCADNCDLPYEAAGGPEWSSQVSRRAATSDAIRALPLPSCEGCNPLKPEAKDEVMQ